MKTAEEVAEHLIEYDNVIRELDDVRLDEFKREIVQALTAYAEERVKEALRTSIDEWRAEALDEAAKIAEFHSGPSEQLAAKIRALKESK